MTPDSISVLSYDVNHIVLMSANMLIYDCMMCFDRLPPYCTFRGDPVRLFPAFIELNCCLEDFGVIRIM